MYYSPIVRPTVCMHAETEGKEKKKLKTKNIMMHVSGVELEASAGPAQLAAAIIDANKCVLHVRTTTILLYWSYISWRISDCCICHF